MHARRSSNRSPDLESRPNFQTFSQTPFLAGAKTPKLDVKASPRPFKSPAAPANARRSPPPPGHRHLQARQTAGSYATYVALRLVRSPRVLVIVSVVFFIALVRHQFPKHAQRATETAMKHMPHMPAAVLEHSESLLNKIAPAVASRVHDWSDLNSGKKGTTRSAGRNGQDAASTSHTFHPNGLMLVNEKGKHPIQLLIDRAEKEWNAKVARQSKTLSQAVGEYKLRYKRNPPKGFDKWFEFAQRNNVQLIDEYDQIHHDLKAFYAIEPEDNRHRNRVMQDRGHTFTVALKRGSRHPTAHGEHKDLRRATDLLELFSLFSSHIPHDTNMTFIIDDNPAVMLGHIERDRMIELADQGEYLGPSEFFGENDESLSYFARSCAPNSPLVHHERGEYTPDFSGTAARSFIYDHPKAVDLCQHPESRQLHGHTQGMGVPHGPLVPLFTFAKTSMHADILVTPLEQYSDTYIGYEPPWEQKSQNKLLWRGSTTGAEFDKQTPWRLSQRARLAIMSQEEEGEKEVLWSQRGATKLSNFSIAEMNHLYFDTTFSGQPAQCDPETCEIMKKELPFKPLIGLEESNMFKYVMDVDGNGWSGRFHRLMSMRSLVLKTTLFPEWYADRVQPWLHYIPVKIDYSDLYDIMAFFIGTPDGLGGHDSIAERLGENGRQWAKHYWRRQDMAAYMFRLILEYSRILHLDGDDVDFIDPAAFNL